ncbi:hypothetical protein [Mameliella alba]|nr:hypothetical protein [Mameliella alba]
MLKKQDEMGFHAYFQNARHGVARLHGRMPLVRQRDGKDWTAMPDKG